MKLLSYMVVQSFAVFLAAYLLPGVRIESFLTSVVVAVVLGILNTLLKPILVILTLPITLLTLGLFYIILNALLVLLADRIVPGFSVANFWWALLFSFVVSIVAWFLNQVMKK